MIDQKFIGKKYPQVSFAIEKEKHLEFLIAIKANQGLFSDCIHPTFPVVFQHELLSAVLFDSELQLNLKKLVHGEQEFIYNRPIQIGETLVTQGTITKIFTKATHDFVVFETISRTVSGEELMKSIWTFVIRDGNDSKPHLQEELMIKLSALFSSSTNKSGLKAYHKLSSITAQKLDLNRAKQDLVLNSASSMQVFVDKYMPQVYAGASGDFNIIHLDSEYGRQAGLGGNILHGMATMAMGANFAAQHNRISTLKRYKARFAGIVKPLDVLTYQLKESENSSQFVFHAINQDGKEVLNTCICDFA